MDFDRTFVSVDGPQFGAPSLFLSELKAAEQMEKEEWPEDAKLYQPLEQQLTLPEKASCEAVQAYLHMCGLPFQTEYYDNAEFMSAGGRLTRLPMLHCGSFLRCEFEPIVQFVEHKSQAIGKWMDEGSKMDVLVLMALVENSFTMAELYFAYKNEDNYRAVTSKRIRCVYPWPISSMQCYRKRQQASALLRTYQWNGLDMKHILHDVEVCCEMLEAKLKPPSGPFFLSAQPCALDALVYGHVSAIVDTPLPDSSLANVVNKFEHLINHKQSIYVNYFGSPLPGID